LARSVERWSVLIVALLYLVIGIVFAALAREAGVAWRLAAWVVSAALFAAHIGYEYARLRRPPRTTALHASLAVALGAFGLAVAATVHAVATGSLRGAFAIALVAWPILTGVPAYLVALAAAAGLSLAKQSDEP
jgi:hypothetical protein